MERGRAGSSQRNFAGLRDWQLARHAAQVFAREHGGAVRRLADREACARGGTIARAGSDWFQEGMALSEGRRAARMLEKGHSAARLISNDEAVCGSASLGDLFGEQGAGVIGLGGSNLSQLHQACGDRGNSAIVSFRHVVDVLSLSQFLADLLILGA